MDDNEEFKITCYKNAMFYLVNIYSSKAEQLSQIDESKLIEYVSDAEFLTIKRNETVQLNNGGYIFKGELE